jgi:hypothetical protein
LAGPLGQSRTLLINPEHILKLITTRGRAVFEPIHALHQVQHRKDICSLQCANWHLQLRRVVFEQADDGVGAPSESYGSRILVSIGEGDGVGPIGSPIHVSLRSRIIVPHPIRAPQFQFLLLYITSVATRLTARKSIHIC